MTLRVLAATILTSGVLAGLSGCCEPSKTEASPGAKQTAAPERPAGMSDAEYAEFCRAVKPGEVKTVNAYCAVMHEDPVDPAVKPVVWKGQTVGFCCAGCMPKWNKMTDAQKDAAVAGAVAKGKPAT